MNVAREPGYRSKIAVVSHADGVDPVGACVGPRGSRVRMVVSELRGEKIDIIPYNDEPARFVAKALSPARVREVLVDDENKQATVVVPDDQLSLAIGKEGQNARLAARLTGWRVDIKSETRVRRGGGRARARARRRTSPAAATRSSARASAARTRRCRARATAACPRTRRSRPQEGDRVGGAPRPTSRAERAPSQESRAAEEPPAEERSRSKEPGAEEAGRRGARRRGAAVAEAEEPAPR